MKKTYILALAFFLFAGCSDKTKPNREYLPGTAMLEGPDIRAQEGGKDGSRTGLEPPENSIPRLRYVPEMSAEDSEKLKNPLKSISAEELAKLEVVGAEKFKIYCAVCHGDKADGKSKLMEVSGKSFVVAPPSLVDSRIKGYSDGRLYYVITYGWGLMGNYSNQIHDEKERWAVVNHLRRLQNQSKESGE